MSLMQKVREHLLPIVCVVLVSKRICFNGDFFGCHVCGFFSVCFFTEKLVGTYDFLYLPIDFKNNCNLGYAFVNMRSPADVLLLHENMQLCKWELSVRSSKICKLKWGRVQGKKALLGHFLGTMHLNDTPCGFKPVTIDMIDGKQVVTEVI